MIVDMITPKTALKRIIESRNSNASYAEDGVPRNGPVSGLFPGLFPGLSGPVSGVLFRKKNEHFFCQSGARKWGQLGVGNGVSWG